MCLRQLSAPEQLSNKLTAAHVCFKPLPHRFVEWTAVFHEIGSLWKGIMFTVKVRNLKTALKYCQLDLSSTTASSMG